MRTNFISLFLTCILFGCSGAVTHTALTSKQYPASSPANIEVYLEKQPSKPFDKISIISTNMWKENLATNVDWVKREAAKMGADAVVLISTEPVNQSGALMLTGGTALAGGGSSGYRYSFYAVKFVK